MEPGERLAAAEHARATAVERERAAAAAVEAAQRVYFEALEARSLAVDEVFAARNALKCSDG